MLQEAGNSLIGVSLIAGLIAVVSLFFGRSRHALIAGLGAAFSAHLVALGFAVALVQFAGPEPATTLLVFGNTAIEEIARIAMLAFIVKEWARGGTGLTFGLGFGALEGVTKFADLMLYVSQSESGLMRILAATSAPIVPWLLHIMLSVVAMSLRRAGFSWLGIFLVTTTLHAAHNASVLLIVIEDYGTLVLANLVRGAVLIAMVVGALGWSKSLNDRRQTTE